MIGGERGDDGVTEWAREDGLMRYVGAAGMIVGEGGLCLAGAGGGRR